VDGEEEVKPDAVGRAVLRTGVDSAASVAAEEEVVVAPAGMKEETTGLEVEEEEEAEEVVLDVEESWEAEAEPGGRVMLMVWPAGGRLMSRFGLDGPAVALRR
jgi:hypothetical protein